MRIHPRSPLSLSLALMVIAALTACTPAGDGALRSGVTPSLRVDEIAPLEGALEGGTVVDIDGDHLGSVTAVTVAGRAATILSVSAARVTVEVPSSIDWIADQVVDLSVWVGDEIVATLQYTYRVVTAIDRQLQYAFTHWQTYNLDVYGDFTTWGGDCMNFVSQTLVARGWATRDDWFNDAQQTWAPAFVHVPSFDEWLGAHSEYGAVRLTFAESGLVKIGDIVMFDWDGDGSLDHAQVVSGFDGDEILMVGHDRNSTYRSITQALGEQGTPDAQVFFWMLPAA